MKENGENSNKIFFIIFVITGYLLPVFCLFLLTGILFDRGYLYRDSLLPLKIFLAGIFVWFTGVFLLKLNKKITVVPLMAAWIILTLIWMIGGTGYIAAKRQQHVALCQNNIKELGEMVDRYNKNKGIYPSDLNTLYSKKLYCPITKIPYEYIYNNKHFTIYCTHRDIYSGVDEYDRDNPSYYPQYSPPKGLITEK